MNPFLTCALMLPLLAMSPIVPVNHHRSFAALLKSDKRILLVGGDSASVTAFRERGLKAFGALTEDRRATRYHAVAEEGEMPFLPASFQSVYWKQHAFWQGSMLDILQDVLPLVEPEGVFIFNEEEHPYHWPQYLKAHNWIRLPLAPGDWSAWERRIYGNQPDRLPNRRGPWALMEAA
jgi:hypothetical protein